jgi:tetratricopeptide (TPR) repeat protein
VAERHADDPTLLALAQMLGDDRRLAIAYYRIGSQAYTEGNNAASLQAFQQALEAARRAQDLSMEGLILPMQVVLLTAEGDLASAAGMVDLALETAARTGDLNILARALTNLAQYYQAVGDMARSVQLLQQQVEINQQQGNRLGEAIGQMNLGYYYLSVGQFTTGHSLLERAVQAARSIGARSCLAYGLLNLGLAGWRLGQHEAASQALRLSLEPLEAIGDQRGMAARQFYLGLVLESMGELVEASAQFESARAASEQLGMPAQAVEARAGLARVALQRCDFSLAEQHAAQLMAYLEKEGPQGLELPMLIYLTCARVFQAIGATDRLRHALEDGCRELQARLERIGEMSWQETFLEAVPENRALMAFGSDCT